MGGSHERSDPCTPFRQRHFKFGKSSSQRSNTNSGAAQSSPISMTRGRAFPGGACKAASRVDSGENRFFKSLRYQAMNAHWCFVIERRPRRRWGWAEIKVDNRELNCWQVFSVLTEVHFRKGTDMSTLYVWYVNDFSVLTSVTGWQRVWIRRPPKALVQQPGVRSRVFRKRLNLPRTLFFIASKAVSIDPLWVVSF